MNETKPPSILDPSFVYIPSDQTDVAATFARVRSERPYFENAYEETDRDHHMMFPGGFE